MSPSNKTLPFRPDVFGSIRLFLFGRLLFVRRVGARPLLYFSIPAFSPEIGRARTCFTPELLENSPASIPTQKTRTGFTNCYNLTRLVYYESFVYPDAAIAREKEIKGWRRNKKIRLIESVNLQWHDLAESWADVYKPPQGKYGSREIPASLHLGHIPHLGRGK